MKQLIALILLCTCACDQEPQQDTATPAAVPESGLAKEEKVSKAPLVLPMPTDQKEVDRMILAGYTPHGEHLHPPGVSKCPLADGKEAVM